jgi:hypothetical protein
LEDNEATNLFADEGGEIRSDDFIHVAMTDDEAIAVRNRYPGNCVTVFSRYRGSLKWSEMEEDSNLG